jgi:HPt (histidine-containing phosphotransfer) domain-containing protein
VVTALPTAVVGSDLPVFDGAAFGRTASFLAPETASSYLQTIVERCEALLKDLHVSDALTHTGADLAEAAHKLAGSAGMFGFERLVFVARHFERAVKAGLVEATALADGLATALEDTLQAIHDRMSVELGESRHLDPP